MHSKSGKKKAAGLPEKDAQHVLRFLDVTFEMQTKGPNGTATQATANDVHKTPEAKKCIELK